jgi:integrase
VERGAPKILTVEQCELLMERAQKLEPTLIPYLALALFCGIRPEEISRLESIDIERGIIEISSAVSKTRQRRLVTLNLTALEWLKINSKLPIKNFRRKFRRVRFDLIQKKWISIVPWHHDILRHTAASMLYEKHGAVYASKELGHSESILFSNYREIVSTEDCQKFWNILPKSDCKLGENSGEGAICASSSQCC